MAAGQNLVELGIVTVSLIFNLGSHLLAFDGEIGPLHKA